MNRILMPLAAGYKIGTALRTAAYRRGWFKTRRLNQPVISVGNLSFGGTGKTPFVAFLVELLVKRGWRPGILTRGYGRRKGPSLIAIEPEADRAPDPREIGDEPAMLAKKLPQVPIVVCADRHRAGLWAENKFNVDVHVLDDGFQHLALARDVDIVLLDSTKPLSGEKVLPSSRLREPSRALRRAHLLILTRAELADPARLENQICRVDPQARIFRCTTKLKGFLNLSSSSQKLTKLSPGERVHGFCGIGNPSAFFADLKKWGVHVSSQAVFPDHHRYQQKEVAQLISEARRSGVKALVTTEKDAINLPQLGQTDVPILQCLVETEVIAAAEFETALFDRLKATRVDA